MDRQTLAVLASAAEAIHASSETHRRAQEAHRRQRKRLSIALAEIHAELERHGIHLEITQTQGGHSGRRTARPVTDRRA